MWEQLAIKFLETLPWIVILAIAWLFRKSVRRLLSGDRVGIETTWFKVWSEVLQKADIPPVYRKELRGLSSTEIWILSTIARSEEHFHRIDQMNPALKVGARVLLEMGLVEKTDEGRRIELTPVGKSLIQAAATIL